jgi:hypothetical protein
MPMPTQPLWDFSAISDKRRRALLTPFEFEDLIEEIRLQARDVYYRRGKGGQEAKGKWRPQFSFQVPGETFDRFFNSPYGYRGQFLAGIGREGNRQVVSAMIDRLIPAFTGLPDLIHQVRKSLEHPEAKIWIDETHHDPQTPDLIVQIRVDDWEVAAREADERLCRGEILPSKMIDRIYGVRAPEGTTLKIFGAWIDDRTSELSAVPSKLRRSEDIQRYGVS